MAKWIINTFKNKKFIICSECNSVIDCTYIHINENEFDYCPYCGEKIDRNIEKEFYSSSEVDKLTKKQLSKPKIMNAVMKSMLKW